MASVIHKIPANINNAKACCACLLLKTGKYNNAQKIIVAITRAERFNLFFKVCNVIYIESRRLSHAAQCHLVKEKAVRLSLSKPIFKIIYYRTDFDKLSLTTLN